MGSDRGTGLAALRSPAAQASTSERSLDRPPIGCARLAWHSAAALETTRHAADLPELEPLEEDDGAVLEINQLFRRRLAGLRRQPRHQRADALQAARDWRRQALRALKERRSAERHARHLLRQSLKPTPR
jgi:hypothetical protein